MAARLVAVAALVALGALGAACRVEGTVTVTVTPQPGVIEQWEADVRQWEADVRTTIRAALLSFPSARFCLMVRGLSGEEAAALWEELSEQAPSPFSLHEPGSESYVRIGEIIVESCERITTD